MIKAIFQVDLNGDYKGFRLKGHAGYADSGYDIICAAVTALTFNTVNSIENFTEDTFELKMDEEKTGQITVSFPSKLSPESTLLVNSLKLGLEGIRYEYGTEYISVKTRRCRR